MSGYFSGRDGGTVEEEGEDEEEESKDQDSEE